MQHISLELLAEQTFPLGDPMIGLATNRTRKTWFLVDRLVDRAIRKGDW